MVLSKCLKDSYPNEAHHIEIICILGQPPTPGREGSENEKMLGAVDARFITYDTLIRQTKRSYGAFLERV